MESPARSVEESELGSTVTLLTLAQAVAQSSVPPCPPAQLGKATAHPGISPKMQAPLGTFFEEKDSN